MMMQKFAWILFLGALAELYVFVKVVAAVGFLPAVLLAICTSLLGVVLLRVQGVVLGEKLYQALARGEMPAVTLVDGGMSWISAVLLILPGFITDGLGLVCLVPPVRRAVARRFMAQSALRSGSPPPSGSAGPRIIEGDCVRERDEPERH